MDITILEFLYLVITVFTVVIGTLLTIILLRIIRILNTVNEFVDFYQKIKQVLGIYSQMPAVIKEKVKSFFSKKQED